MDPEKKGFKASIHKKINIDNIFIGLVILLGILVIINVLLAFNLNKETQKSVEAAKEKIKPARVELAAIKNSKCSSCFDASTLVSHVKNANVNITSERDFEFNSPEGRSLISRYKIEKIPTLIVTGEIDKISIQGLERKENALILTKISPPYTDVRTGEIKGRVALTYLKEPKCDKCLDLAPLINQIKSAGVKILEEKIVLTDSDEGKELLKKYGIDFAPTIILSKDADVYSLMQQAWPQIGSRENDGSYVFRGGAQYPNLPSINLTTGQLRGLVDIAYLSDKTCSQCYNVQQHKQVLANSFAIHIDKEEVYDVDDAKGKELIAKYNITQVPTVILSNEASVYPSSQALRQFFSVEKDGSYVFRKLSVVGTYKDLTTNQVVQAQQQTSQE